MKDTILIVTVMTALLGCRQGPAPDLCLYIGDRHLEEMQQLPAIEYRLKNNDSIPYAVSKNYYTWINHYACKHSVRMLYGSQRKQVWFYALPPRQTWVSEKDFCNEKIQKKYPALFDFFYSGPPVKIWIIADEYRGRYTVYPMEQQVGHVIGD